MIAWRSIEYRLTAWYSLLLLTTLVSLSVVLWFGIESSMRSAVDDLLAERLDELGEFVEIEFSAAPPDIIGNESPLEFKGMVTQLDLANKSLTVNGTRLFFDARTDFEGLTGRNAPDSLENGQFVEVEAVHDNSRLIATSVEGSPVEEELMEYVATIAEGNLIQIRTEAGEQVIPTEALSGAPPLIPWREPQASRGSYSTVETTSGPYRILTGRIPLLGSTYKVLLVSSLKALDSTRSHFVFWVLWTFPFALLFSFAGGFLISRSALKPVDKITELATRTGMKSLSTRLSVPHTGDAIERLATAFNNMLVRLESSLTKLERFTADASHELRTPLSVIRTTTELALRHGRTAQDYRRDMGAILSEAERLTELIEDLLVLARADHGTAPFTMTAVDLSDVVRSSCKRFRNTSPQHHGVIDFREPEDPISIEGHEPSLARMITALLENAAQHASRGGSITVLIEKIVHGTRIQITDNGQGIPREELSRIFDRFYRVDPSRSRSSGGFGLGLSIVKWIVESHGGSISVDSEVGEGTKFTILFPAATKQ